MRRWLRKRRKEKKVETTGKKDINILIKKGKKIEFEIIEKGEYDSRVFELRKKLDSTYIKELRKQIFDPDIVLNTYSIDALHRKGIITEKEKKELKERSKKYGFYTKW